MDEKTVKNFQNKIKFKTRNVSFIVSIISSENSQKRILLFPQLDRSNLLTLTFEKEVVLLTTMLKVTELHRIT